MAKNIVTSQRRTALIVLGMHRSGTSALAGVLAEMGADLPQGLMATTEMNAKGFFESNRITQLNEDLLASAGFTWWDFRRFTPEWFASPKADEFAELAVEALDAEYGKSRLFVMKDPRVCRLAPFWLPALRTVGCRPLVVHIHRHPLDVSASLDRWAGYEPGYGLLLWLRHVLDAEAETRGETRVFTSFDQLLGNWPDTMARIGSGLNLHWPRSIESAASAVADFLSNKLQHFSRSQDEDGSHPALSPWIEKTHAILERWVADGENSEDHATLDSLRHALDTASPSFSLIVRRAQESRHEASHLRERCDNLHQELKVAQGRLSKLEVILERERWQREEVTHKFERTARKLTRLTGQMTARMEQELEGHLADKRAESEAKRRLGQMEAELLAGKRAESEAKRRLREMEAQLASLYTSTSWRITAPLRCLSRRLRLLRS